MLRRFAAVAAALLALGCDTTEPSPISGTWTATEFLITETGGDPVDVLAAGGGLTISVTSNNTTSGTLVIPASVTGDAAVNASMAGTATIGSSGVEFNQAADTFVRDMTWTVVGNTMTASQTFSGTTIDITLTRQ